MSAVRKTTKREVLTRFRDLIRTVTRFENRVYIRSSVHSAPGNQRDRDYLTVGMIGGQFNYAHMSAAGRNVVHYQGTIRVKIWRTDRRDRSGNEDEAIAGETGMLQSEHDILKTVTGSYLPNPEAGPQDPSDCILINNIAPLSDSEAEREEDEVFDDEGNGSNCRLAMIIDFSAEFSWDLSS